MLTFRFEYGNMLVQHPDEKLQIVCLVESEAIMHQKRIISLVFSVILSLTILTPAYAADMAIADSETAEVSTYNEYDYIMALKNAPAQQNAAQNNSDVAEEIRAFEEAFAERAALPDETLEQLGYSSDEIHLLRRYASGEALTDSEMRAATATCTGVITKQGFSGRLVMFTYTWTWDKCPTTTKKDSFAVRFCAIDSKGYALAGAYIYQKESKIKYYTGQTHFKTVTGNYEAGLDAWSANVQFPLSIREFYDPVGGMEYFYAKTGYIKVTVSLKAEENTQISYIQAAGLYGHTVVGLAFPSISVGLPLSIAISFTGNKSIQSIAGQQVIIDRNPGCQPINNN